MKDLDFFYPFIYSFSYFIPFFWCVCVCVCVCGGGGGGGGGGQNTKMGAGCHLRQEKCDKSLNILPILICKVFFMELHTPKDETK